MIRLQFNSAFTGNHFTIAAAGSGTDVTLASNAGVTFASLDDDALNFVSDDHLGLINGRSTPMHGPGSSLLSPASGVAPDVAAYGCASHTFIDHSPAHAALGVCKA